MTELEKLIESNAKAISALTSDIAEMKRDKPICEAVRQSVPKGIPLRILASQSVAEVPSVKGTGAGFPRYRLQSSQATLHRGIRLLVLRSKTRSATRRSRLSRSLAYEAKPARADWGIRPCALWNCRTL